MVSYERKYGTARAIFTLLEIIGWLVTAGGVIVFFAGMSQVGQVRSAFEAYAAFGGMFSGVFFTLTGLISVAFVQSSRANVDQAEMSRDMLALMRKGNARPSSGESLSTSIPSSSLRYSDVGALLKTYKSFPIFRHEDGVSVSGSVFGNVIEAEQFIDGMNKRK